MRYPRFALVAVLTLATTPTAWSQPQLELVLHFTEIGQGDCTLIECPRTPDPGPRTGWLGDADGDGVVKPCE